MKNVLHRQTCKTWVCILFIAFLVNRVSAQDFALQIERDVWIPLLAASGSFDAEAFLAAIANEDPAAFKINWSQTGPLTNYHSGDTLLIDDIVITQGMTE